MGGEPELADLIYKPGQGEIAMRHICRAVLLILCLASWVYAGDGLVTIESAHGVQETADRLATMLTSNGLTVFNRIDHAEGAKKVDQSMRPTELILFGNPKVGTPLMQCARSMGIDLPQKALVWEDETGQVWLTYNDPAYLAERHGITTCAKTMIPKIQQTLRKFATAATQP
jgi:uncharacterized protein (DUF302 family)